MRYFITASAVAAAILSLVLTCAAQPPDTLWTKIFSYSGEDSFTGNSVKQTTDGGYIIAGYADNYGSTYLDALLIKTDAYGVEEWHQSYGGSQNQWGRYVQQTSDDGYITIGLSDLNGYTDIYLFKTETDGTESWHRLFGGIQEEHGNCVEQTSDGGYIIAGTTYSFGSGMADSYLIKTDADGNEIWHRSYGGLNDEFGLKVRETPDGGYIIVGTTYSFGFGGSDVYLIRTNSLGDEIWNNSFGGTGEDRGRGVVATQDGGFAVAGYTNSFGSGSYDFYLIKTDSAGNQIWQRTFGGVSYDYCQSIQQTLDRGYILVGQSHSFGSDPSDFYMVKTDGNGNELWHKILNRGYEEYYVEVQQTLDGGYIVAGYMYPNYYSAWYKAVLIRLGVDPSLMVVNTTPINPPITIPANGGSFQYNINVHNLSTQVQTGSVWNKVRNSLNQYTQVFGPVTRTLPAGANPSRVFTQTIAGSISSGTLYFITYMGTYPSIVQDSSFFTITKSTVSDGGPFVSTSFGSGDFFDEYAVNNTPIPEQYSLSQNYPNPFNATTTISYALPSASFVNLSVYDISGRKVAELVNGMRDAGVQQVTFDGSELPSGVYIYRLTSSGSDPTGMASQTTPTMATGKMVLLK
jgi:hypothetical protein